MSKRIVSKRINNDLFITAVSTNIFKSPICKRVKLSVCQTVFTFGVKYVFEFVVDTFYITHNF